MGDPSTRRETPSAVLLVVCVVAGSTVAVGLATAHDTGIAEPDGRANPDAGAEAAQQSVLRVENPERDNRDGDGNTSSGETNDGDDADGSTEAAVDAADDGDRIEVASGTYQGASVALTEDVTLAAPEGATLSGDGSGVAITVAGDAAPVVSGFTVERYGVDVPADSAGDWTVAGATVRNANRTGVVAVESQGAWQVNGSTAADNGEYAIDATGAAVTGDAIDNWWSQSGGPTATQCVGNVDCGSPLTAPPESDAGLAAEFDSNDNGEIDFPEVVAVIGAFNDDGDDRVTDFPTVVAVITEYDGDGLWANVDA